MAPTTSVAITPVEVRRAWRYAGLLFALGTVLLFGLFHDTVAGMVKTWSTSDTFGFGFLILPIVIYLSYQRRRQLAQLMPQPCFWALLWIAGAMLLYLIGAVGSISLFKQLAFVGFWQGLFAVIFGWPVVRQTLFPLFFLVASVPMGEELIPMLQKITAEIAVFLLRSSGVPTFHSGILIEIPSGSFVVADVCSGSRFLITTLVLGALAANLFFLSWRRRVLFMLLCLVVPIFANGLRAYGVIMLAHFVDYRLAISVDHIVYGFIFLAFVFLILIGLGAMLRDRWLPDEATVPVRTARSHRLSASSNMALLLAALMLAGGKAWSLEATGAPPAAGAVELSLLHPGESWNQLDLVPSDWEPAFPGADFQLLRRYQGALGEVDFFIAHYNYQRDGHEAMGTRNSLPGRGRYRQMTGFEKIEVVLGEQSMTIREIPVHLPEGPHLIWSWYDVGGSHTISPIAGKLLEIWHTLRGGSRSATAFALMTPSGSDPRSDRARLEAFLAGLAETRSLVVSQVRSNS